MGTHLVNSIGWRDGLGDVPDCVVSSPVLRLVVGCAYVCADRTGAACVCKQRQLQQQGSAVAAGAAGGAGERAVNSMNNHAEGFAFFATAVVLNIALRGPENGSTEVAITALAHAGFRLGHCVAYLLDIDIIRSLCFFLGIVANFVLYAYALSA